MLEKGIKLKKDFYLRPDVVKISRELLGKALCTNIEAVHTSGIITETEAYEGIGDRASHAYGNRRTARTRIMYAMGGVSYVFLCYGMHHLFNVVTNNEGIPDAILIRMIKPMDGINTILERRRKKTLDDRIASGPGSVSQALGITVRHNGTNLTGKTIWIEDRGIIIKKQNITAGARIGVGYAGKDALKPYRFTAQL